MTAVEGVLFDIDDTLVDLEAAMGKTLRQVSAGLLPGLTDDDWIECRKLFTSDPLNCYNRYLSGELTFVEQRMERARHAHRRFGRELDEQTAVRWNTAYEAILSLHFEPFPDVMPLLDALDTAGIPFGAISNNVHDYQRAKLDRSGLSRIQILVGIDTVGAAKPDPAIFLEGTRLLGTAPERTVYVGDNREVDAEGASAAGLIGVWLDRIGADAEIHRGARVTSLNQVEELLSRAVQGR